MSLVKATVRCPYCKEKIISGATRCKHCQADLTKKLGNAMLARYNTFRTGFLAGVLFSILLAVLVYSHLTEGQ